MKALTWQGRHSVEVIDVPDPRIEAPTDAIIRVTSTAICGSDLHLYEALGPYLKAGDILGHEPMGIVAEVGAEVSHIKPGDRVVIPFNISCGHCWMCDRQLYAQCETTQNTRTGKGASLFGYTSLYGSVPGGQAEYLRVPQAQFGPIKVPHEFPDDRFLFLSDVLPTAWQALAWADVPKGGTVAVLGLGPIGGMCARIALQQDIGRVIGVDVVPDRIAAARAGGIEVLDANAVDNVAEALIEMTGGRGPDSVVDAVGMEAAKSPLGKAAHAMVGYLPDPVARAAMEHFGVDRMNALLTAVHAVRRGGTVSLSGVYGGAADPMPMLDMFDRGITLRMGQCHVRRWIDDILPLLLDTADPLGVDTFATHHLPLPQAAHGYEIFQKKLDNCRKVVLRP
jgi:threonine dehydrogenase-like Zn-dependent dehydrogenase